MDTGFDMETYVKQRLTEITDVDERSFAKEVLLKGLLPAFRTMERRYQELEERVFREVETESSQFCVFTTIIRRQDYDPTNLTWFPIDKADTEEEEATCLRVYFLGNTQEKKKFEKTGRLSAVDANGVEHSVGIRKAYAYQEAVENLYHIFVSNRIPWNTINTGYMDRFYEIYPLDDTDNMEGWQVSYGEWGAKIHTDYIPLWNVEKFHFHCRRFMVPGLDGKYYEHELILENQAVEGSCLLEVNEDILSIRYEQNKVIINSLKETFDNWTAFRFVKEVDMDSYGYCHPILGNGKKETFADCLAERWRGGIHSKTEIFRIVETLGVGEYIVLKDCGIRDQEPEGSIPADMNLFIREEVFPMETRRIMELQFVTKAGVLQEAEPKCYIEDLLRYVVSQIQLILDEYKCVGVLE